MGDRIDHRARADAWILTTRRLPPEQQLGAFEQLFAAMWGRTHVTLGDITLTAILNRVLWGAAQRFPLLAPLKADETGLRCEALRAGAAALDPDELTEALRFVLGEFLTVLGNLTAEILTPALHAELARDAATRSEAAGADDGERDGGGRAEP